MSRNLKGNALELYLVVRRVESKKGTETKVK